MRKRLPSSLDECLATDCNLCRGYNPNEELPGYAFKCKRYALLLCDARTNTAHDDLENVGYKPCTARAHYYRANRIISSEGIPFICEVCGSVVSTHVHHVDLDITNNVVSNLQVLCKKCHEKVHNTKFF